MKSEHTPPTGAPPPIELVVTSGGDTTDPNDGVLTLREAVATSGVIPTDHLRRRDRRGRADPGRAAHQ